MQLGPRLDQPLLPLGIEPVMSATGAMENTAICS
jgi:hypothetical protein